MSMKTRVNGYTAWANLRLSSVGHPIMGNIIGDLLDGLNLKTLIESITGRPLKRFETLEGLPPSQRETRVQWILDELIKCEVVSSDVEVNTRTFAKGIADEIYNLLWPLVCYDINFVWERADFLLQDNIQSLVKYPFSWVPPAPEVKPPSPIKKDLLAGFSAVSRRDNKKVQLPEEKPNVNWTTKSAMNSRDKVMINHTKVLKGAPYAVQAIIQMINLNLKKAADQDAPILEIQELTDIVDSRVLCVLVNSFIPNTFTAEVLLNDR